MTTRISTASAKDDFIELVNRVALNKDRVVLTRRDKEIAAIIPIEDLYTLLKIESKNDLEEAMESLREARIQGSITLEQFKGTLE